MTDTIPTIDDLQSHNGHALVFAHETPPPGSDDRPRATVWCEDCWEDVVEVPFREES